MSLIDLSEYVSSGDATLALKAGVHPRVVSERLGHANVGITLDLYSHVVPSLARDAAEQIMSSTYGEAACRTRWWPRSWQSSTLSTD